MQYMTLKCNLTNCNIDSSKEMNIDKCVLKINENTGQASPCYYLIVKSVEEGPSNDAWSKFNNLVDHSKKKSIPQ